MANSSLQSVRQRTGQVTRAGACSLSILFACLLCSCAVGPDFVRPEAPGTERYTTDSQTESPAGAGSQKIVAGADIPASWWSLFQSEQLNNLVNDAVQHNATLEASLATLRQSQHNLQAGYGVFFPQLEIGFGGTRERTAPIVQGLQSPSSIFNVVTLSGSIGYSLDLFGGERRAIEQLSAQTDYQQYASKAAYVTLTANVVNTSIARAAYVAQIHATEQLIALEREQLEATRAQVKAGTAPYSAELATLSLVAANTALLAPLKQQLNQADNLLATLEGKFPGDLTLPVIDLDSLTLPQELPLSLPSELVHRRPDILQSEAQLHAASASIGVTTAALFPSISLTGTIGQAGTSLGNLSGENGRFWSVGPAVSIPVFRGGTLWYGRQAALDAYQSAQAAYRQTVLTAFAEVATELHALENDAMAFQAQRVSLQDAREAYQLTQANYRAGMASYLDVVAADVQFHQATIACIQASAQRYQDTVALFVASGGGWWNIPDATGGAAP